MGSSIHTQLPGNWQTVPAVIMIITIYDGWGRLVNQEKVVSLSRSKYVGSIFFVSRVESRESRIKTQRISLSPFFSLSLPPVIPMLIGRNTDSTRSVNDELRRNFIWSLASGQAALPRPPSGSRSATLGSPKACSPPWDAGHRRAKTGRVPQRLEAIHSHMLGSGSRRGTHTSHAHVPALHISYLRPAGERGTWPSDLKKRGGVGGTNIAPSPSPQ